MIHVLLGDYYYSLMDLRFLNPDCRGRKRIYSTPNPKGAFHNVGTKIDHLPSDQQSIQCPDIAPQNISLPPTPFPLSTSISETSSSLKRVRQRRQRRNAISTLALPPFHIRLFGISIVSIRSGTRRRNRHPDRRPFGGWYRLSVGRGAGIAGRRRRPDIERFEVSCGIERIQTWCIIVKALAIVILVCVGVATLADGEGGDNIPFDSVVERFATTIANLGASASIAIVVIVDVFELVNTR